MFLRVSNWLTWALNVALALAFLFYLESTCEEVATLCHQLSTGTNNMDPGWALTTQGLNESLLNMMQCDA